MKKWLSISIGILIICFLLSKCSSCSSSEPEVFNPKTEATKAAMSAQRFIKSTLKSPSSANFPFMGAVEGTTYNGDSTFTVSSYVDAQNTFGVKIRSAWTVILKRNKTTDVKEYDILSYKME